VKPNEEAALLGQLAADATIRDALLVALMEHLPRLLPSLEAKVLVAALGARAQLPRDQLAHYDQRRAEVMQMLRGA